MSNNKIMKNEILPDINLTDKKPSKDIEGLSKKITKHLLAPTGEYNKLDGFPQYEINQIDVPVESEKVGAILGRCRFASEKDARKYIEEQRNKGFQGVLDLAEIDKLGGTSLVKSPIKRIHIE